MPSEVLKWINQDLQVLLWSKDPEWNVNMGGATKQGKALSKASTTYAHKTKGGLGLLHWESHLQATRIALLLEYMDPAPKPWKEVLDVWLARQRQFGRRAMLTSISVETLTAPLHSGRACKLPKVFISAINILKEEGLHRVPGGFGCQEEAMAEPIFYSHIHKIGMDEREIGFWSTRLETNRVQDLINYGCSDGDGRDGCRPYTWSEVSRYLYRFRIYRSDDGPSTIQVPRHRDLNGQMMY